MRTLEDNLEKLKEISELKDNWNGYEADLISREVIEFIDNFLHNCAMQPDIFPLPSGGIQVEYDREDGAYLEFTVSDEDIISVFILDRTDREFLYDIVKSVENLNSEISKFMESENISWMDKN